MRSETLNRKNSSLLGNILEQLKETDFVMLTITLVLAFYGLVMVFSASYYFSISESGNPFYYLIRDGIWVVLGIILMCLGALIDYRKYNNRKIILAFLLLCLLLLVLVLTPAGSEANDATRWIKLGPITIMPGEIAKMGMIFFVAWFYSENTKRARMPLQGLLPVVAVMGVFALLIIKQPNLSTAITLCGIVVVMMLVAGMRWLYVILLGGLGVLGVLGLILGSGGYWLERFTTFTHPFDYEATSGYQIVQGLQALGSGGLFGVGLGKSVTKSLYLPYPHNDFILAIIGEETGYLGILFLLVLYCIFIWRGVKIALNCQDEFGLLLASGTVLMVAIQVVLNLAVVTSSMPATGVNLPFVSYGGNALMIFMFMSGVVLNISRHIPREKKVILERKEERHESNNDWRRNGRTHIPGNSHS
ncbi:MAG: putative lipid II flippase FtsW [Clostridia bacterium]|nr:putative lipid II flippase FtsW [Clostridia bacterium]